MKFPKAIKFTLMFLATMIVTAHQVWACACCAENGQYRISMAKPGNLELSLMKRVRFGDAANLFTGEAEVEDAVKGLAHPAEKYSLSGQLVAGTWKLSFREGNNLGSLNLLLPAKFLSYGADIHDGQMGGGGGPLLYKEWRFEGVVYGSGVFRGGLTAPARYFLVFQGRGNNCDNAEDFTHWRLEITGRKASYAFFGDLAKPAA
jgi:hypothetical protein